MRHSRGARPPRPLYGLADPRRLLQIRAAGDLAPACRVVRKRLTPAIKRNADRRSATARSGDILLEKKIAAEPAAIVHLLKGFGSPFKRIGQDRPQ
jgi:hypothetical protein